VSFNYKEERTGGDARPTYGLIAEEVAVIIPELVGFDEQGRPQTVRCHLLTPMLLSELQRLYSRLEALGRSLDAPSVE
jgi:hypothetical protein